MPLKSKNYELLTTRQRRLLREAYVASQGGKCCYCQHPLDEAPCRRVSTARITWELFPDGFQNHPVHLHHNHATGMTIGAVHMRCNAYVWQHEGK